MAFHSVHSHSRNVQANGQRLGAGGANQQRADQARTRGVGDGFDLRALYASLSQHLTDQRQHALDVIARSQLRHYAAEHPMLLDLTEQGISQQAALAVIQSDTGFVAGGFQAQHQHGFAPLNTKGFEGAHNNRHPIARPALFDQRLCILWRLALISAALENRRIPVP